MKIFKKILFFTVFIAGITTFGVNAMMHTNAIMNSNHEQLFAIVDFLRLHQNFPTSPITGDYDAMERAIMAGNYGYVVNHLVDFGNSSLVHIGSRTLLSLAIRCLHDKYL